MALRAAIRILLLSRMVEENWWTKFDSICRILDLSVLAAIQYLSMNMYLPSL